METLRLKQEVATSVENPDMWPRFADRTWQETVYVSFIPFVKYLVSRLLQKFPPHIVFDDLLSAGTIGLLDAVQKYDPCKNIMFKSYAEFRIKGAIIDELRKNDWIPKSIRKKQHLLKKTSAQLLQNLCRPPEPEEIADALKLGIEEYFNLANEVSHVSINNFNETIRTLDNNRGDTPVNKCLPDIQTPLEFLCESENKEIICEAIRMLPERESLLISLYYYEDLTMKEVASVMGYTESRISQLHKKAIERLGAWLTVRLREQYEKKPVKRGRKK